MTFELSDSDIDRIAAAVAEKLRGTACGEPMTAEELAKRAGLNPATIRRRVAQGLILRVPHTHKVLIPAAEAQRILSGQ